MISYMITVGFDSIGLDLVQTCSSSSLVFDLVKYRFSPWLDFFSLIYSTFISPAKTLRTVSFLQCWPECAKTVLVQNLLNYALDWLNPCLDLIQFLCHPVLDLVQAWYRPWSHYLFSLFSTCLFMHQIISPGLDLV